MSNLRQALEDALVADPDDRAAHAAYADLLSELGDPRGEFIQVQLALEDPTLPATARERLLERERALVAEHSGVWLGSLAAWEVDPDIGAKLWRSSFARGWLDQLSFDLLRVDVARDLAADPHTRLLRRLAVADVLCYYNAIRYGLEDAFPDGSQEAAEALEVLAQSPYLGNVRAFHLGSTEGFTEDHSEAYTYNSRADLYIPGHQDWDFIKRMHRLEELHLFVDSSAEIVFDMKKLTGLRVLQVYLANHYPLEVLAENPAMGRLSHLLLHPRPLDEGERAFLTLEGVRVLVHSPHLGSLTHLRLHQSDLGDAGCVEIVHSGILKRLKFLDLARGAITDQGAAVLAACPDLRRLEVLDVSCNALTREGIAALQATGITIRAGNQHDFDDEEYLHEGEME